MSELRQNPLDGNWVVISPERGRKPSRMKSASGKDLRDFPERDEDCPFCPGNDDRFPLTVWDEVRGAGDSWALRVIENKYKIFDDHERCPVRPEAFKHRGIYTFTQGCGTHDLVIESPRHNEILGELTEAGIELVLGAYRTALLRLRKNGNNLIGIVFKNQGPRAGGSQPHAHSQIVGSRVVPSWVRGALHTQERHFDEKGICPMCRILDYENEAEDRVVFENETAVVLSPYAASAPYEMWVVPKKHKACFHAVDGRETAGLAAGVKRVLGFYAGKLGNPDYNMVMHSAPYAMESSPFFHVFLRFLPRMKIRGGFEVGTNIPVNAVLPEAAAEEVRLWAGTPAPRPAPVSGGWVA